MVPNSYWVSFYDNIWNINQTRARILVQVTVYLRPRTGQDGHLNQSEAYDI